MARRDGPYESRIRTMFREHFQKFPADDPSAYAKKFKLKHFAISVDIDTLKRWAQQEKLEPGINEDYKRRR
jgi:hypothetical protein